MRRILDRLSPSLAVSLTALFIATGGSTYAAIIVPANGVGSKQLKNGAVSATKLHNGAVTAAKISNGAVTGPKLHNGAVTAAKISNGAVTGPKMNFSGVTVPNATHASNATNATNATNASRAGTADNASSLGGTPASSYVKFGSTFPSGNTETGVWATAGGNSTGGNEVAAIRFYPPLRTTLDGSHTLLAPATGTAHCSGPGHADPGYLCVYVESSTGVFMPSILDGTGTNGASADGAIILYFINNTGSAAFGFWAVTAP